MTNEQIIHNILLIVYYGLIALITYILTTLTLKNIFSIIENRERIKSLKKLDSRMEELDKIIETTFLEGFKNAKKHMQKQEEEKTNNG